jgi:hypothetical protein
MLFGLARGVFDLCDQNNNGGCTLQELVDTGKNIGKPIFFFLADKNGEINEKTNDIRWTFGTRTSQTLRKMCDTDNSGGCSLDEIGQMVLDNFGMFFDLVDLNGDGQVSFDDFVCDLDNSGGCSAYEVEVFLN